MGCIPSKVAEPDMAEELGLPSPIRTIVVLVMENRSFDHLLGWQKQLNPEIDGVTGEECNAISTKDPNSELVYFSSNADYVAADPGHEFEAVCEQVFGSVVDTSANPAPMNGFAQQAETISVGFSKTVMSGFKPEAVPVHTELVREFAVFDKWFASVPSSTQPNRQFVHSATSHGLLTTNVSGELLAGLPQRTIFDNIHDSGLTFGIYFQSLPATLYYKRLRQIKYLDKFHEYNLSFKRHAKEGKLPNYVVIEPRYFNHEIPPANDDHPPHNIANGQALIKEVYETLRASPQWNELLLIITYDEHGGFFDHVPTPVENVPNPDGIKGPAPYYFDFDRLGVRVPTIMVSPWIEKGTVIHSPIGPTPSSQFEHSSIPATVKKLFNLPSDFLTKRDAWAGTFENIVSSRRTPRTDCPVGCIASKVAKTDMAEERLPGPIKTIVVLVMENRSFDHMLGWQKQLNPEIDGVTGKEFNPISTTDPNSQLVYFSSDAEYIAGDPGHSFQAIREQVFGSSNNNTSANPPPMNGFAQQAETISVGFSKTVMSGFKPDSLPVHTQLVREFAVFDKWFASVPSSTQPNRQYVHSATSHGLASNVTRELLAGMPQRTIFDSIYDAGLSFGIYFQSLPSTFYYRRLRQLKYLDKFHLFDLSFKQHAKEGKLPNYVVIEPRYFNHEIPPGNDDHPPHDVTHGQALIKEVYEALRESPQWNETLLIITYDEHGGFYDHVPSPVVNVPNPDGLDGPAPDSFKFNRLGVRVPTIMVSPWIEKGTVIHAPTGPTRSSQFEHSSIPATVKKLFNLPSDFLTKRDAWAGTFENIVSSRTAPRDDCPEVLESVRATKADETTGKQTLSEFQEELVLLAAELKGEVKMKGNDDLPKVVGEASKYVLEAITTYLDVCKEAKAKGANPSCIVCMKPSPSSQTKPSYDLEQC